MTVIATFPARPDATEDQPLQEAGIVLQFPAKVHLDGEDVDEVLYNRVVFPVVTRTGNLEMSFTWEVLF